MSDTPKYSVTNNNINGFATIKILEGEFIDVEYCYGAVGIQENKEGTATLKFEITLVRGEIDNRAEFDIIAGDILINLIDAQMESNDIVYTGGV